jgi:hypothetical protein
MVQRQDAAGIENRGHNSGIVSQEQKAQTDRLGYPNKPIWGANTNFALFLCLYLSLGYQ